MRWLYRRFLYRVVMRIAHRFHWHYAPPVYPDGDTMLWCHWCGMRDVVKRGRGRPDDNIEGPVQAVPSLPRTDHVPPH